MPEDKDIFSKKITNKKDEQMDDKKMKFAGNLKAFNNNKTEENSELIEEELAEEILDESLNQSNNKKVRIYINFIISH